METKNDSSTSVKMNSVTYQELDAAAVLLEDRIDQLEHQITDITGELYSEITNAQRDIILYKKRIKYLTIATYIIGSIAIVSFISLIFLLVI